ncbi:MAG: hypothetical protein WB685_14550, partial [Pseudolabrys sp.]
MRAPGRSRLASVMLADLHRCRGGTPLSDVVCVVSPRRQFAGALHMLDGSLPMRLGPLTEPYVVS